MLYALSVFLAPILPVLVLMMWAAYLEDLDLLRLAGHRRCWRTYIMYTSTGICLFLMIFVTFNTLFSKQ